MKIDVKPLTGAEIDRLKTQSFSHFVSAILVRMAIVAYLKGAKEVKSGESGPMELFLDRCDWDGYQTWPGKNSNQGFAAWKDDVMVITYRGSEAKLNDWNANRKATFPEKNPIGGFAHRGFTQVFEETREEVRSLIEAKSSDIKFLWLCGHSLGGALATAMSANLLKFPIPGFSGVWNVSTIGAPRFGDPDFETAYEEEMLDRHWHYVNEGDPVPHLPPMRLLNLEYRHVGQLKWFHRSGVLVPMPARVVGLENYDPSNESEKEAISAIRRMESIVGARVSKDNLESDYDRLIEEIRIEIESVPGFQFDESAGVISGEYVELGKAGMEGDVGKWIAPAHNALLYLARIEALAAEE